MGHNKMEAERRYPYAPGTGPRNRLTPARIKQAGQMREDGAPWSEIGRAMGMSADAVKSAVMKAKRRV